MSPAFALPSAVSIDVSSSAEGATATEQPATVGAIGHAIAGIEPVTVEVVVAFPPVPLVLLLHPPAAPPMEAATKSPVALEVRVWNRMCRCRLQGASASGQGTGAVQRSAVSPTQFSTRSELRLHERTAASTTHFQNDEAAGEH